MSTKVFLLEKERVVGEKCKSFDVDVPYYIVTPYFSQLILTHLQNNLGENLVFSRGRGIGGGTCHCFRPLVTSLNVVN